MRNVSNIIRTDSYKVSHFKQYPPGTTNIYSYLESRGGMFAETVFFGLQYYLKEYLSKPITMADVDYAEERVNKHLGPGLFNRTGWERIVNVHNGYFPVKIMAVPEGTVVPTRNVLMAIENTDPELPWVTNYIETILLKVWYTTTVATLSREIKKLIKRNLEETGDPSTIDFKLHDFGYRGASSEETAMIGGMSHLINFKGTDTMIALEGSLDYYGEDMAGFSIAAAEHSTITAWGREFEYEAYQNMIRQFGNGSFYAVVSDSYDIYNAVENIWGEQLKAQVLAADATLVIRPDSGIPHQVVVRQIVEKLGDKFGYIVNNKGFKVLNKVRVIQGDGITLDEVARILEALKICGWSGDNVAFGMGGALLQQVNRDTNQFAIKASSMMRNGKIQDFAKKPATDIAKWSKAGRLKLIKNNGIFETVTTSDFGTNELQLVWENGKLLIDVTFDDIRARAIV